MAANYLQSLSWRNDTNMMKIIIQFYTKAKAMQELGRFYEVCAHIEIDEYQNYEKALAALRESEKCLSKAARPLDDLQNQQHLISLFIEARNHIENMNLCENLCAELLNHPQINVTRFYIGNCSCR